MAEILKTDKEELLILWLADQLYDVVKDEDVALKAMEAVEEVIINKKKSKKQ